MNEDTEKDIKNHIDDWKKFVQVRGSKGGRGSPIYERILKERKKWEQLTIKMIHTKKMNNNE
jgi:predicted transcriptional regulator|tara:strand:- start:684 stop:869 length:186 start_codon:yes stop_codon:yes gene_type:complete